MTSQLSPDAKDYNWTLVVAISQNNVIGKEGGLPWRLSSDLRRFKEMTMGHALLMGRKTFESIGRALPGRQTIVLSRRGLKEQIPGVQVVGELQDVANAVEAERQVMVVGGAEIYRASIQYCKTLWVTRVLTDIDGDVSFPEIAWSDWTKVSSEVFDSGPMDDWPTEFQVWNRKPTR